MEKCEKLLNHLEDRNSSKDAKIWLDIEAHAKMCPDCALDMIIMNDANYACSKMDNANCPENLHSLIMQGIEFGSEGEISSSIDSWFDKILEPLQLGFVTVSIFMIFFLFSLSTSPKRDHPAFHKNKSFAIRTSSSKDGKTVRSEDLDGVSADEVKEFLAKLEQYKKSNPEIENKHHKPVYQPNIRLVNDWNSIK